MDSSSALLLPDAPAPRAARRASARWEITPVAPGDWENGLRGGVPGSWPVDGEYGRYEVLNRAAKFFADALMRHTAATAPGGGRGVVSRLA